MIEYKVHPLAQLIPATYDREYKVHPLAQLIPAMSDRDYQELKEDIRKNGQRQPIILYNRMLIDGRHRLRACRELGIVPNATAGIVYGGTVAEYIWSANVARRHLTDDQRAALATAWVPVVEAAAKQNLRTKQPLVNPPKAVREPVHTREAVAARAQVSPHKARQAIEVAKKSPAMIPKVASGEVKLKDAVKMAEVIYTPSPPKAEPTKSTKAQTKIIDVPETEPGCRSLHVTSETVRKRVGLLAVELVERLQKNNFDLFDQFGNRVRFVFKKASPCMMTVTTSK